MRVLSVTMPDGAEYLERHRRRGRRDELFLAEALDCAVGEPVAIDIWFAHSGFAFRVGGAVVSRRLVQSGDLPAGALVALSAEGDLPETILAHARGEEIDYRPRADARTTCQLRGRLRSGGRAYPVQVVDLASGGCRVAIDAPLGLGSAVSLRLLAPGSLLGIPLRGRVVWRREPPTAAAGIRFEEVGRRTARALALLRRRLHGAALAVSESA